MSRATRAVWEHSQLNRRDASFQLLLWIADRASDDGVAWPGRDELARRLGVVDRTIRRCIETAVAAGELELRHARDGRTVYRLILPGLDPVDMGRLERQRIQLLEPFSADTHVQSNGRPRPPQRTPTSSGADTGVRPTRARSSSRTISEPSRGVTPQTPLATLADDRQVESVYGHWRQARGRAAARYDTISAARRDIIEARLAEFTADQLCAAIDAIALDPWPDRERLDDLPTIFRTRESVDRFLDFLDTRSTPSRSNGNGRSARELLELAQTLKEQGR